MLKGNLFSFYPRVTLELHCSAVNMGPTFFLEWSHGAAAIAMKTFQQSSPEFRVFIRGSLR